MSRRVWFDRRFALGLPPEALPDIVERLRGTPARLEERVGGLAGPRLVERVGGGWSIQENAGHLVDLEALWIARAEELAAGVPELREADLTNRATEESGWNGKELLRILEGFRAERARFVALVEGFDPDAASRTGLHPRLKQPMSIVDLAFFVAEHDDHHLARITELRRARDG